MELCAVPCISSFNISFIKPRVVKEFVQDHTAAAAKLLQSCLTLCDHRWQPTRLPHPWGSELPFPSPMYESEK